MNTIHTLGMKTTLSKILDKSIVEFIDDSVKTIALRYAFYRFNSLQTLKLPNLETVTGYSCLQYCPELTTVDVGKVVEPGSGFLSNCPKLKCIILRNNSAVCNVTGSITLDRSELKIYVPQSLLEQYKTNANYAWSNYAGNIFPLEGSPYEDIN